MRVMSRKAARRKIIVKHAVQYHHGTVELHSEEGKGTTICILLPKE